MDSTRLLASLRDRKGIALVYTALIILVLVGFLGLAVDLGHLYLVRGQLQNAADATSLAGAWSLYRDPSNPGAPPSLDFSRARTAALNFIKENKTDGVALADGTVEAGYWPPPNPDAPLSTVSTDPKQVPAVRAKISRSDGSNDGPVPTFFMKIVNASSSSVEVFSRPAVAVTGFAGSASVLPLALSRCMTEVYFSKNPLPDPPTTITIGGGSTYAPGCTPGQWTSLLEADNSANHMKDLFDSYKQGTGDNLQVGDNIYIDPGMKASVYKEVPVDADVFLPIVGEVTDDITKKDFWPITGFAWFHIDSVDQGKKTITGHFIGITAAPPGSHAGGALSNALAPPALVQ